MNKGNQYIKNKGYQLDQQAKGNSISVRKGCQYIKKQRAPTSISHQFLSAKTFPCSLKELQYEEATVKNYRLF